MSDNQQNNQQRPPMPPPPSAYRPPSQGSRWWIPVVIIFGTIGLFLFTIFGVIGYIGSKFSEMSFDSGEEIVEVNENSVLYLNFSDGAQEYSKANPFENFGKKKQSRSFLGTLDAIKRAKNDDLISGIYIKPMGQIPTNRAMEINEAIKDFKESGKFVYSFIEAGNEISYLMASTADSVFMPVEGLLEMNGYGASSLFMKGFFKKLGVEFHVQQFEDFKSAAEGFSRNSYSDSAKYQLRVMINNLYNSFLNSVEDNRGISADMLHSFMNEGHYTASEMKEFGLIDAFMTETELKDMIEEKLFGDVEEVDENGNKKKNKVKYYSTGKYLASDPPIEGDVDKDNKIAIIYGTGPIYSGKQENNPFGGGDYEIRSRTIVEQIREAAEDEDIKAIIMRIDSPGGSVIASDEIWNEIVEARKSKPVIASMSSVAASGGYYMAMACDKIVAHPNTITGSIGVILQIPNFSGTMDMLDITADTISTGDASQFLNGYYKYTDKDKNRLKQLSYQIYKRFVDKVAESRGMTFAEARSLAKGRVWMGSDAYEKGLVDKLGGIQASIDLAKEMIDVDSETLVPIIKYPKQKDAFEEFIKELMGENDEASAKINLAQELGLDPVSLATNWEALPEDVKTQIAYAVNLVKIGKEEKVLMALPQVPIIK